MYSHVQFDENGQFVRLVPSATAIHWDGENYCTAFALEKDGKAEQFRVAPYYTAAQPVYDPLTHEVQEVNPACVDGKWTQQWQVTELTTEQVQQNVAKARAAMGVQIDEAVAAIYSRFTRFQLEYTEREAQAKAYKDAGYTGPVPAMVAQFATPAGVQAQAATDLILSQAANLRTAQAALSALRMRKYEVLRAESGSQARATAEAILQAIAAVGEQVS